MDNSLKYAFLKFVKDYQLIAPDQRILVAVSGGLDSMVLLHLLLTWRPYFNLNLAGVHFNHQLRGRASDKDEELVKNVCVEIGIPLHSCRGDVRKYARENQYSLEEAGRILRENCFLACREREGYEVVATAHQLNDQVETLLMRVLEGTGLAGLAGIRLKREGFIRPLLFAERTAIEEYARRHGIRFREDPSNRNVRYKRNKVRHQLLPLLQKEFNLTTLESFLHLSLIVQEWLAEADKQMQEFFEGEDYFEAQNKIGLDIAGYKKYFSGIQIKILEKILRTLSGDYEKLSYNRFRDFSTWLQQSGSAGTFLLTGEICAEKQKHALIFKKYERLSKPVRIYTKLYPGQEYQISGTGISVKLKEVRRADVQYVTLNATEFLDAHHLRFPLVLRTWRPGDRFQPLGLPYKRKVSDFLTDEQELLLPKREMLVLVNDQDIVAVLGCRISDSYKITDQTQKVLKLEIEKS